MEYHQDRFDDMSLVVMRGGQVVGLLPASMSERQVTSHAGLTFGGLIVLPQATLAQTGEMILSALGFLARRGFDKLSYRAIPAVYSIVPAGDDLYWLWRLGASLSRRDVSTTVVKDGVLPMRKGRRQQVAKAHRAGVKLGEENDFHEFHCLLSDVLRERHDIAPTHTSDELTLLAERFPDNIKLFTARTDGGELASGVVMYLTPRVAHAQYIASSVIGLDTGAGDMLLDSLIERFTADDLAFDFGISTTDAGYLINEGLLSYKEGFGGRTVLYDQYELNLKPFAESKILTEATTLRRF